MGRWLALPSLAAACPPPLAPPWPIPVGKMHYGLGLAIIAAAALHDARERCPGEVSFPVWPYSTLLAALIHGARMVRTAFGPHSFTVLRYSSF